MKKMLNGGLILGLLVLGSTFLKADNILYISDTAGKVGTVDLTTDSVAVIGNTNLGSSLHDIAFTSNGNFYGVSLTALYSLNVTTGASSLISSLGGAGNGAIVGLLGDGANLLAGSSSTSKLYVVDASPFSVSTLAGTLNGPTNGDMTFGSAGSTGPLYDILTNGNLDKVTISGTTITSTVIGNTGNTKIAGMATGSNGVVYAISGTEIWAVDINTAVLTPIFNYAGHGLVSDTGAAAKASLLAVPEPTNLALLIAGIAGLALYQSRKRVRA